MNEKADAGFIFGIIETRTLCMYYLNKYIEVSSSVDIRLLRGYEFV